MFLLLKILKYYKLYLFISFYQWFFPETEAGNEYRLRNVSNSPFIGKAVDTENIYYPYDITGQRRAAPFDIGAYNSVYDFCKLFIILYTAFHLIYYLLLFQQLPLKHLLKTVKLMEIQLLLMVMHLLMTVHLLLCKLVLCYVLLCLLCLFFLCKFGKLSSLLFEKCFQKLIMAKPLIYLQYRLHSSILIIFVFICTIPFILSQPDI